MIINDCILNLENSMDIEPGAATWLDQSRYKNHGTITAGTGGWVQEPSGLWVYEFDGAVSKVVSNSVTTGGVFGGAHSMLAWVKLSAWGTRRAAIGAKAVVATFSMMGIFGDNRFFARPQQSGVGGNAVYSAATYNNDTDWHFLAAIVDADGHLNHFIVDGTDEGNNSTNNNDLSAIDTFDVGNLPLAGYSVWSGKIGAPKIYTYELSVGQILNYYEKTKYLYGVFD